LPLVTLPARLHAHLGDSSNRNALVLRLGEN
jgi:hypothetical protein